MATILDDGIMQQLIASNAASIQRSSELSDDHDNEIRASQRRWADGQNFNMRSLDALMAAQLALADENANVVGSNLSSISPTTAQHPALPVPFGWPVASTPQAPAAPKAAGV